MKLLALSITLLLTACAGRHTIETFSPHLFSADKAFILENLNCTGKFQTDQYNSKDNETFRCSADNANIFLTIESDGNNAEDLKSATLIWKQWRSNLNYAKSKTVAQQFTAVFAKMYAQGKELEFVDAFFNKDPIVFESAIYNITTSAKIKQFYTIRKAKVEFK